MQFPVPRKWSEKFAAQNIPNPKLSEVTFTNKKVPTRTQPITTGSTLIYSLSKSMLKSICERNFGRVWVLHDVVLRHAIFSLRIFLIDEHSAEVRVSRWEFVGTDQEPRKSNGAASTLQHDM